MTKYFKAKVELRQTAEVEVAAENEASAKKKAISMALQKVPGAQARQVDLTMLGESQLGVGTRIKHSLFGPGEIVDLTRSTNVQNEIGFFATVKFDSGDSKKLHLPHASVRPEAFDA